MPNATIKDRQHLTHADQTFIGKANSPLLFKVNKRHGIPVDWIFKADLGSPIATDANAVLTAATGAELPNAATKTYTTANSGSSPIDDAGKLSVATVTMADGVAYSVFVLDVPRNITTSTTHASAILAMTVKVTGFDEWGQRMVETHSVGAGGTGPTTTAGKKAFKWIWKIEITAAGNATTNTLDMGFADVLGLPYKLTAKSDVLVRYFNDAVDTAGTLVLADTNTATATTGDVRGTFDPNSACNGSAVAVWYRVADHSSAELVLGVPQYAG